MSKRKKMGSINFQKRFAAPIRKGIKTTTIRKERKDGARPIVGSVIPLYTGQRTKQCVWVADVRVLEVSDLCVTSEGLWLTPASGTKPWLWQWNQQSFWKPEGFASADDMQAWFAEHHPHGLVGWLCRWELVRVPRWAWEHVEGRHDRVHYEARRGQVSTEDLYSRYLNTQAASDLIDAGYADVPLDKLLMTIFGLTLFT